MISFDAYTISIEIEKNYTIISSSLFGCVMND